MMKNSPLPFKRKKSGNKFENLKKVKLENGEGDEVESPRKMRKSLKKHKIQKSLKIHEEAELHYDAELLNEKTIKQGMLLLGCVIEIRKNFLVMSLPGCLKGFVGIRNISDPFTKILSNLNDDQPEPDLRSLIKLGMMFPCKVMTVPGIFSQKRSISLSINPQDVNGNLRPQSLYQNMVLFAAISSKEDHGFILDVGVKGVTGFLPNNNMNGNKVEVGQVIPTQVKKLVLSCKARASVIQLRQLSFSETFPLIKEENIKLTSVLPGANVTAKVNEVKYPFAYMECLNFRSCSFLMTSLQSYEHIKEGSKVNGTVLFVHPVTNLIYLHLGPQPSPDTFPKFFSHKKFDLVQIKFQHLYHNKVYCKLPRGAYGIVHKREFKANEFSLQKLVKGVSSLPRGRVMFLHFMDNLVQLSLKKSIVNKEIKKQEDFKIGDICEGFITKHCQGRIIVSVCPGVKGFIRQVHLSDAYLTKPEKSYPLKTKVTCRVLRSDSCGLLHLTCKKSLLCLLEDEILKSYDDVVKGQFYKGVIVDIAENYIVVLFFNDIKGKVSYEYIPQAAVFFVGQTVECEVLHCFPLVKKLILSLQNEKFKET